MYGMSGFAEKLNIQNCENWTGSCVHYMHGMSGLAEKLNIPHCIYSMGNGVHYIHTECLDLQKNWISWTAKIQREIVYIIYGSLGFAAKLNIQNYENSTGNFLHYIHTERLDLQKIWISRTAKIEPKIVYTIFLRNVRICKEIEFPEPGNLNRKLYT